MSAHASLFLKCLVTTIVLGPPIGYLSLLLTRRPPGMAPFDILAALPGAIFSYFFVLFAAIAAVLIAAFMTAFAAILPGLLGRLGMPVRGLIGAIAGATAGVAASMLLHPFPARIFTVDNFFAWASIDAGAVCGFLSSLYWPGPGRRITVGVLGVLCGVLAALITLEIGLREEGFALSMMAIPLLALPWVPERLQAKIFVFVAGAGTAIITTVFATQALRPGYEVAPWHWITGLSWLCVGLVSVFASLMYLHPGGHSIHRRGRNYSAAGLLATLLLTFLGMQWGSRMQRDLPSPPPPPAPPGELIEGR